MLQHNTLGSSVLCTLDTPKVRDSSIHIGRLYARKPGALTKPESTDLKIREREASGKGEEQGVCTADKVSHFKPQGINFKRQSIALDTNC